MRRSRSVLLLFLTMASTAFSQEAPQWRMIQGDDPRWAQPLFDDSAWQSGPGPTHEAYGDRFVSGTRWYRATFTVPEKWRDQDLAIGLGPVNDAYELFVEGVRIGKFGSWEPKPEFYLERHLSFAVPAGVVHGKVAHVAIRRWNWTARTNNSLVHEGSGNYLLPHPPILGLAGTVAEREARHVLESLIANLFAIFTALFLVLCGWVSLALFQEQRSRAEYLWLGVSLIFIGFPRLLGIPIALTRTPVLSFYFMSLPFLAYSVSVLADYLFLAEVAPRLRFVIRSLGLLITILGIMSTAGMMIGSQAIKEWFRFGNNISNPISFAVALAVGLFCLWERRTDSVVLALGLMVRTGAEYFRVELTWLFGGIVGPGVTARIPVGPLLVDVRDVAHVLFAGTLLGVFWVRFKREQRRKSIVEAELAAARKLQELFLGAGQAVTPGFSIEAVYRPANEVGGDFYQVLPGDDGSVLVVVGDVSGKGLKAAMLVAAVVGSLRTQLSRRPGEVLEHLNRSLVGQTGGGFVTCCCALFLADGQVVIANAGHISPYVNGQEVLGETGLPLALVAGGVYSETSLRMETGALTLLSDGVVEARNGKGELFGFERTAELTRKSANEVADAAQAFGQDDDITVVTVRRALA